MRGTYPKSPAERRWGMHRANILPPRGVFAVRSPQIMHGARILPPSGGPAPAQGLLPEQLHRGIAFQRLGPCPGVPAPSAPPIPATCQCPPPAVPIAARDKPPMSFGGGHPAHGLQSGQAPRGRRLHHLDGQAGNGMLRRTGPGFQNREQAGAEPQAEAAGPAGPASALPKTPIERTGPSWRSYRSTPPRKGAFPPTALLAPSLPPIKGTFGKTPIIALGARAKSTTLRLRRLEPAGIGFLQNGAGNPICKRDEVEHGQTRCLLNRRRIRRQVAALKQDGLNIRMLLTQILR